MNSQLKMILIYLLFVVYKYINSIQLISNDLTLNLIQSDNYDMMDSNKDQIINKNNSVNNTYDLNHELDDKLEYEEKVLLKKKNDLTELLKINISNFDLDIDGKDFDTSYRALQLINEKLHNLKNITETILRIKQKKLNKMKERIEGLNIYEKNDTKRLNITLLKSNKTNNNETSSNLTLINVSSNNMTFTKFNSSTTNNSIGRDNIININETKYIKSSLIKNITIKKNKRSLIIRTMKVKDSNSKNSSESRNHSLYKQNNTLFDYLENKSDEVDDNKTITRHIENLQDTKPQNLMNDTEEPIIDKNENNHNSNTLNNLNEKSTSFETTVKQEKNEKEIKGTVDTTNKKSNLKRNITFTYFDNHSNDSLFSKLIIISLSLIVIGLLMGVMLGLILVMYLKTKKENK